MFVARCTRTYTHVYARPVETEHDKLGDTNRTKVEITQTGKLFLLPNGRTMRFLSVVIFRVVSRQPAADSGKVDKVLPADGDNDDAAAVVPNSVTDSQHCFLVQLFARGTPTTTIRIPSNHRNRLIVELIKTAIRFGTKAETVARFPAIRLFMNFI